MRFLGYGRITRCRPLGGSSVCLAKVPVTWVGRERRFSSDDIDAMKAPGGAGAERPRLEGLYLLKHLPATLN